MSDPFGIKSKKKAAAAQEAGLELQQQQQTLQAALRRRDTVREARVARGQVINQAGNAGTTTSSTAQGAEANVQSQLTANLSFLDNFNLMSDQASAQFGLQRKYERKAKRSAAIWKLGTKAVFGGIKAVI